jgi:hypothetical protein
MERKKYIVKILTDGDKIDTLNHKKDKVGERGLACYQSGGEPGLGDQGFCNI